MTTTHRGTPCGCPECKAKYAANGINRISPTVGETLLEAFRQRSSITFPRPVPVSLPLKSRRCVVTCASGVKGKQLLELSGPLMRDYAARCNADFVVLEDAPANGWPMSVKFGLSQVVRAYDWTVYMDADILLPKGCISLFGLHCGSYKVMGVNELPRVLTSNAKMIEEYQRIRISQGMERKALPWYLNTGLILAARSHADVFDVPTRPILPLHCAEQHLWNARLHDAARDDVGLLAEEFNYQHWWNPDGFKDAPDGAILHFSGMACHAKRLIEMRKALHRMAV